MSSIRLTKTAAPATPATGTVVIYVKDDGLMYLKDSDGNETPVADVGALNGLTVTTTDGTLTIGSGVTLTANETTDVLIISGTAKLTVGTSEPSMPSEGDLWVDTN